MAPKKIIQDVVSPRTIRQVHVHTAREEREEDERIREMHERHERPQEPRRPRRTKKGRGFFMWLVIIVCVAVVLFAISLIYSSATVKIKPKTETISVDNIYAAKKNASSDELQYEVMTMSKEASQPIEGGTGTPERIVSKAKGKVTLYNDYSDKPQKLISSTRIENFRGLVYRLDSEINIPGYKTVNGKKVPGSIVASVTADNPGPEYNMTLGDVSADFKVTAFKTDAARKDTFYGKLASSISGGFNGMKTNADPIKATAARNELDNGLRSDLVEQAKKQVPDDYILFDGANVIKFDSQDIASGTSTTVTLREKATLNAVIFKRDDLVRYVAKKAVEKYKGRFTSSDLSNLQFNIADKDFSPGADKLNFGLKGDFTLVGTYPEDEIKERLVNKSVKDIGGVLSQYGTIVSADVVIRPFWKRTFPDTKDKITIETASK